MTDTRFSMIANFLMLALTLVMVQPAVADTLGTEEPAAQVFPPPFCSPYNINIDLHQDFYATAFERTAEAGLGGVRLWAWWKWMEPTQGSIDFTLLDALVSEAEAQGLNILLTFVSIPPWANGSSPDCDFWNAECSAPPTDPSYYRDFVTAVVTRYGNRVMFYGVWNEPNLNIFWSGSFYQYIQEILINGSNAIRAANPYARVVGPDTVFSTARFERALTDACEYLDILSVHDYPGSASTMLSNMDNQYHPIIQSTGCEKPLWVTEFGIDSADVGETVQAAELVEAYQGVKDRAYLEALFVYRIQDHAPWAEPPIRLGIVRSEFEGFERKAAFWAIRDFIANAGNILCPK